MGTTETSSSRQLFWGIDSFLSTSFFFFSFFQLLLVSGRGESRTKLLSKMAMQKRAHDHSRQMHEKFRHIHVKRTTFWCTSTPIDRVDIGSYLITSKDTFPGKKTFFFLLTLIKNFYFIHVFWKIDTLTAFRQKKKFGQFMSVFLTHVEKIIIYVNHMQD